MLECKMRDTKTIGQTSSMDIIALANRLKNDQFREKLLDSVIPQKRTTKPRNARFKVHPDAMSSSSDSDVPREHCTNGFTHHHHHRFIYDCTEKLMCDSERDSSVSIPLIPKQTAIIPKQFPSRVKRKSPPNVKQTNAKLFSLLQRIYLCIESIRISTDMKIVKPDGTVEWEKRRTRSAEFCSRLQRNYIYQLTRQIADLHKGKSSDQALPLLTSAYQTLLQAFQAYHNHIPISLGDLVVDKLRVVVEYANDLCDVYEGLLHEDNDGLLKKDFLEKIRNGCATVLSKVNEMAVPLQETVSKKRPVSRSSLVSRKKCTCKKALSDKLSMYSIPNACKRDLLSKKRTVEKSTRCAPCVQSRYKTAGFKHRPPVQNKSEPVKAKLFPKRILASIKETPVGSPKNEDDIETMVKVHKDNEMTITKQREPTEWEQVVLQFKGLCERVTETEEKEVSQAQLEILLKNLMEMALSGKININTPNGITGSHKDLGSVKSLPNLAVSKPRNGEIHIKNGTVESALTLTADSRKESTHSLQSQWKILEVSGAKNAQLICIRDEGSAVEVTKNPNPSLATLPPEATEPEPTPTKKVPEDKIESELVQLETKISSPPPRKLAPLPKHKIKAILHGKLSHAKVMKMLPMYCKSTDQHPWEVVNSITHRLLEDILLVISKEIQVGDILQSLYNSEFL